MKMKLIVFIAKMSNFDIWNFAKYEWAICAQSVMLK